MRHRNVGYIEFLWLTSGHASSYFTVRQYWVIAVYSTRVSCCEPHPRLHTVDMKYLRCLLEILGVERVWHAKARVHVTDRLHCLNYLCSANHSQASCTRFDLSASGGTFWCTNLLSGNIWSIHSQRIICNNPPLNTESSICYADPNTGSAKCYTQRWVTLYTTHKDLPYLANYWSSGAQNGIIRFQSLPRTQTSILPLIIPPVWGGGGVGAVSNRFWCRL